MPGFFRSIFSTDFMPHLYCLRGDPGLLWLHVVSDLTIACSYFAIPLALGFVIFRRKDWQYRRVAILSVLFIASCGITHLLAVWTIWVPMYRLEGLLKGVTAVLSSMTALVMFRERSYVAKIPSVEEMEEEVGSRQRAEHLVLVNEERFRSFVDSADDYAIFTLDLQGIIQTWNTGAMRIKGYSADEAIGRHFSFLYTPEDQASGAPETNLRNALEGGRFESDGWRMRKGGGRYPAHVSLHVMHDSSGVICGFSKITRDLTATYDLEERYQMLMEVVPDAVVLNDGQGLIKFVNREAERMFGYSRAELLGQPGELLFGSSTGEVPLASLESLVTPGGFVLGGTAYPRIAGTPDFVGIRKDGSEFPMEFSFRLLDSRVGNSFLFVIRDLTERRKSEMRFQALLEAAPDAMVIVNQAGLIELTNLETERQFGYTAHELVGRSVHLLIPSESRTKHGEHLAHFFHEPKRRTMGASHGSSLDLIAVRKDGTQFPVEVLLSPLAGPNGVLVTASIRDVTQQKMAAAQLVEKNAELHHSNDALEQFAHIASHDLQEPLRMVSSYMQLLARRYRGRLDADADEFIGFAIDGAKRMKQLIEDLLVYSQAGQKLKVLHRTSSEGAFETALADLRAAIEESNAVVTHDPLPEVVSINLQLVQLFQNLIGNAIKYKGVRRPEVHVSAASMGDEWVFSVRDNGIGIEPQHFDRIFQIFQRLHGRGDYEGTGIGLAICQRILQQQGGRIWVESELGVGSVFCFSLLKREEA